MSGYSFDEIPSSPRKLLYGAARPSANPRIHAIQKPYSRPVSYSGPSSSTSSPQHELLNANGNVNGNGNGNGSGSPTKPTVPTTRPALLTSQSHRERAFPRSGSESSLFGSLKGLISKPLSWLATPRGSSTKRDQSTWNAGLDSEDPESPSVKKLRRVSPVKQRGAYDPPARNEGMSTRGKEREMLPPLPALAGGLKKLPTTAAKAVGSLPHSQSMPYLDPPSSALSPARRKQGGAMTRSRGMNLASLANEEEDQPVVEDKGTWSPWKQQAAVGRARTPVRQNRGSISEVRDYALPSLSPFRTAPSPSVTGGLARSATANNLRAGSIASDISMGRQSTNARQLKGPSSMLFGNASTSTAGNAEDAMSVDGAEKTRDGSVLDWFMRDRWSKEPGSPRAARMSSLAPSSSMPPIRKGQLVWNSEKGFVRESELRAAETPDVQPNQAERILFALESMRKTPLADARKETPTDTLPASLIGSSSRQIRRAINVPLATAQAGESARQRRDKERLGGDERVSVMISPYGRRRAVESEQRSRSVVTDDRPTKSPSRSRSQATDHSMASARTPTPEPPRERSPEPTPRRSSRLKKVDNEETPRQKKSTRGKGSVKDAAIETSALKDTGRRRRKATAEPTSPEHEAPPPVPSIPTITETAPSPREKSAASSSYQPRAEGDLPRQSSSLRARTEKTKRSHGTSAHGSRATSPNAGGRYSAREEDLPDMEELEQTKISLPSFTGVSFGNFGLAPPAAPQASSKSDKPESTNTLSKPAAPSSNLGVPARGPLSRLNASRPRASSPLAAGSIVAEPDSPESSGAAKAQKPVKADENGFFSLSTAKPSAPPAQPAPLFGGPASSSASSDTSKKAPFAFGLGKPSAPAPAPAAPASESGEVPDFFGRKSAPTSGSSTPVVAAPAPFSFGAPKPATTEPAKAETPFSFGKPAAPAPAADKPATAPLGSFNFGAKPAETTEKADKPAASFGSFNFGGASTSSTAEPAAKKPAPIGSFQFGAKSEDKPASSSGTPSFFGGTKPVTDTPTAPSPFGQPATTTPAPAASATPKPFTFGAPAAAEPAKSAEASKAPFSFGSTSTPAAEPAKAAPAFGAPATPSTEKSAGFSFGGSTTPAGSPFGGFGAKAPEPAKPSSSAGTPFAFGAASSTDNKAAPASSSFGFGQNGSTSTAPAAPATTFGFGSGASTTPAAASANPFGGQPAQSGSFGFGSSSTTPAAAPAANPFGAAPKPAAAPASAGGFGFTFGGASNPSTASPGFGTSAPVAAPSFGFGQPAAAAPTTPAAAPAFTFGGAGAAAPPAQPSFGFGSPAPANGSTTPAAQPPAAGFRFGSPAPGASPATDGGFSLGMESGNPPGSPSGRKIKPLRRGTKR